MAGITATSTSPVGNMGEAQIHFAKSTAAKAATLAADTDRLVANGGYYREGDVVVASCTDGALVGRVAADGGIVA